MQSHQPLLMMSQPSSVLEQPVSETAARNDTNTNIALWLANTLNCVADGLLATNCCGEILFMNARAEDLTGWRVEDALGRYSSTVFQLAHPGTGKTMPNPLRDAYIEEEEQRSKDCALIAASGEKIAIDYAAAPLRTQSDEVIGAVVVFRERDR